MSRTQFLAVAAVAALSVLSGCSPTCGPSNCSGCCTSDGTCQQPAADHCGQGGASCKACPTGQQCLVGQCAFPGSSGNGAGGSTGTVASSSTSGSSGTSAGTSGSHSSASSGATSGSAGTSSGATSSGGTSAGSVTASSSSSASSSAASTSSSATTSGPTTASSSSGAGTTGTSGATTGTSGATTASSSSGTTTSGPTTASSSSSGTTTSGGPSSSSGTTGGASSSGATSGSSGSTGTIPCQITDIDSARDPSVVPYTDACLSNLVVVMQNSYGTTRSDGGTQFDGKYFLVDPVTHDGIFAFKAKALPPLAFDPARGDELDAEGAVTQFPADAGPGVVTQVQLSTRTLTFSNQRSGTIPAPDTVSFGQLDPVSGDEALIGHYVHVPAGSYSADTHSTEFTSGQFVNGVKLSNGSTSVLVDMFTFKFSANNCYPTDGGLPDVSAGGFNGVYDRSKMADGVERKVVYYGSCGQ